ncbi:MAG: dienelactone hydrolase family protein [Chthonomonas sp.]|nr:dienelactone hydrolase family protein [Chthonomonas sp.]
MIHGFVERYITFRGELRTFMVYVPREIESLQPIPAILHLHGRGESGEDGTKPLIHGVPRSILFARDRWPFIVVMPQKRKETELWPEERDFLNAVLEKVESEYAIDPHRRYLTGLSQGGNGTFALATKLRWHFAAIAPVCGWCDPATAAKELVNIPLWAFHGATDDVVKPSGSILAVEALREAGATPKLTLYPGVGHNSWEKAYMEEALPKWFLSHTL